MSRRRTFLALWCAACLGAVHSARAQSVAEVQISPPYVRMVPGALVQAAATAYDSVGTPVVVAFRWASSNINVATVSDNGLVRAVAPGLALITVTFEGRRARRRAMQVQVAPRGPAPGITIVPAAPPAPGAQGVPPAGAVPAPGAAPPAPPATMVFTQVNVDSTVRASINCAEPMINAVNPLNACHDQRPEPRAPVPTVDVRCEGGGHGMLLMVRVSETGTVSEVLPFARGGCLDMVPAAVTAARTMTFSPALKDGRPVPAWARVIIRTSEPPKQ